MFRVFYISLAITLVSLIIIVALPINFSEESSSVGPSPYRLQIDELYSKTSEGLHPDAPEWKQIDELRRKNNAWFDDVERRIPSNEPASFLEIFEMKSWKVAPVLMFIFTGVFSVFSISWLIASKSRRK